MAKIVVQGNPVDGFNFVGPFDDDDEAIQAAENEGGDWWVADLEPIPASWTAEDLEWHLDAMKYTGRPRRPALRLSPEDLVDEHEFAMLNQDLSE